MDAPLTPDEQVETVAAAFAPGAQRLVRSFARLDYETQILTLAFRALGVQVEIAQCEMIVAGQTHSTPLDDVGLDAAP